MGMPTYDEVRQETIDVLKATADHIPEPKEIRENAGFEPYSCGDSLVLGSAQGSFYTGQWAVFVDDGFDRRAFIDTVPSFLGDGWHAEDLGVQVNFAQVYLVRDSPEMSLNVREIEIDGRKAIDLLAISRCGIVTDDSERTSPAPGRSG